MMPIVYCCDQMIGLVLNLQLSHVLSNVILDSFGPLNSALLLRQAWAELCMRTDSSACLVSALRNWPVT